MQEPRQIGSLLLPHHNFVRFCIFPQHIQCGDNIGISVGDTDAYQNVARGTRILYYFLHAVFSYKQKLGIRDD